MATREIHPSPITMKEYISIKIISIAVLLQTIAYGAVPDPNLPKSKALLEQRVLSLTQEASRLAAEQEKLKNFEAQIKDIQSKLDKTEYPSKADLNKIVLELRTKWQAIVDSKPEVIIDAGHAEYDNFKAAVDAAETKFNALYAPLSEIRRTSRNSINRRFFFDEPAPTTTTTSADEVQKITDQYLGKFLRNREIPPTTELSSFVTEYMNEGWKRSRITDNVVASISSSIDKFSASLDKSNDIKTDIATAITQLLSVIPTSITGLKKQADDIDKALTDIDIKLGVNAASTDRQLIVAVYCMIGALVILFISVRFQNTEIAGKIIENRSLVEVISMAFLLLTIIILGTGEKMPKEAIGTVLGSIAGYIFGRRSGG